MGGLEGERVGGWEGWRMGGLEGVKGGGERVRGSHAYFTLLLRAWYVYILSRDSITLN